MAFGHHLNRLEEIEKKLNGADYAEAKEIVDKHRQLAFKGNTILANLKLSIKQYETLLEELSSDIDALSYEDTKNRLLRREECKAKVELARQQLGSLKEIMKDAVSQFQD